MGKIVTLKKNIEFKKVFNKGKFIDGRCIVVYLLKNNTNQNKLGFVVSKKAGKSVTRNRIRRLIRENFRLQKENLKKGYTIVIMWKTKKEIQKATFDNIKQDMLNIFAKYDLLYERENI